MATGRQAQAAQGNAQKAQWSAVSKKTVVHSPSKAGAVLGKHGAAVARRKRTSGVSPKAPAELYRIARQYGLSDRSKLCRSEHPSKLGES